MSPLTIYCDNKSTIFRASSDCYNEKSKQVCLKHNHVRRLLEDDIIFLQYVQFRFNIADHLSKGLGRELVIQSCKGMEIKPVVDWLYFIEILPNDIILGSKGQTSKVTFVEMS